MTGLDLVLAGAALGNGNRGVEALCRSVLDRVALEAPGSRVRLLDDGWGVRGEPSGTYPGVELVGVRLSRRWHRPESWAQIRLAQHLGGRVNPAARRFRAADAVLDLSAGDSFTDLYGPHRLAAVSAPKEAALRARRPLVLLPQTYGPFNTDAGRRRAESLIRSSALAYARDEWSHTNLVDLAGPDADVSRLRLGVDVAFALQARQPPAAVVDLLAPRDRVLVGVNVSGLLRDSTGHDRFGLTGDYLATMALLSHELIAAGAHVVLVSHVHEPGGGGESDIAAAHAILERLGPTEREHTTLLPSGLDAAELKWCISQVEWFAGSRMHATIAALSTLTPAYGYAYSDKTQGVFETCGMGHQVGDARRVHGPAAVERMLFSFNARAQSRDALERHVPPVVERAREQISEVLAAARAWSAQDAQVEAIA